MTSSDLHVFSDGPLPASLNLPATCRVHRQCGGDFGQRLCDAVDRLAVLGYRRVVIAGGDCPQLSAGDIRAAIGRLNNTRIVLGPDHRGGTYLIAIRTADRHLLEGVRWQRNTDCRQLACRFGAAELLEVHHDIDRDSDLLLVESADVLLQAVCAPLLDQPHHLGTDSVRLTLHDAQGHRRRWQLPPPARAA